MKKNAISAERSCEHRHGARGSDEKIYPSNPHRVRVAKTTLVWKDSGSKIGILQAKSCATMNLAVNARSQSNDTGWKVWVPNGRNRTASGAGTHWKAVRWPRTCDIPESASGGRGHSTFATLREI